MIVIGLISIINIIVFFKLLLYFSNYYCIFQIIIVILKNKSFIGLLLHLDFEIIVVIQNQLSYF